MIRIVSDQAIIDDEDVVVVLFGIGERLHWIDLTDSGVTQ
jgi:hypothetical protein